MTPMQLGISAEIEILRLSVTAGVFMGIIYDIMKIVRRLHDNKILVFILDFVYAVMFGAVFFVFSLAQTDYVRGFVLFGMLSGAAVWSLTVGRLFVFALSAVLKFAERIVFGVPFALIDKLLIKRVHLFVKNNPNFQKMKKIPEST